MNYKNKNIKSLHLQRFFILFVVFCLYSPGFSQISFDNYLKYFKSGDYINAKKEIESAVTQPDMVSNARAWYYRCEVNSALYSKKPEENPGSLEIAYMSLMKSSSLDTKKELSKEIAAQIKLLSTLYYSKGASDFNNQKYNYALLSFERAADIGNLVTPSVTVPEIYFYIGMAAALSNNNTKVKKYFSQLADQNYPKIEVYNYLAEVYKAENNNSAAIETYKRGINTITDNSVILYVKIVKLFLNIGFTNDAVEYLNKGTAKYPDNEDLNYIKASLNTQLNEDDKAIEGYKKTVDLNPNHLEANYNLGIMYYNSSINHLKTADSFLNSNKQKYDSEKELFLTEIKKAAPYLEKAHQLDRSNRNTMMCLLDIYKRLQRKEQYDALKTELDNMK